MRKQPRFKVVNKTQWDSKTLRSFLRECIKQDNKVERTPGLYLTKHSIKIQVGNTNSSNSYSGRAWVGGITWSNKPDITLKIPSVYVFNYFNEINKREDPIELDMKRLARLMIHELQHTRGFRHKQMADSYDLNWVDKWMPIKQEIKVPKATISVKEKRYKHSKEKLIEVRQRIKRLQTSEKKWKRKVRYYEREEEKGKIAASKK